MPNNSVRVHRTLIRVYIKFGSNKTNKIYPKLDFYVFHIDFRRLLFSYQFYQTVFIERSSAIVTPKYFAAGTLSSSTLCTMYLVLMGFAFLRFEGPDI